jgi:hypothetical protein
MNSFDGEMHIWRHKELARRAAEQYAHVAHLDRGHGARAAYRKAMAGLGGRLVVLGYRLQGEIEGLGVKELATD